MTTPGLVSLVGAGPGDPELITLKGVKRLREAEVIFYDRLIDPRILDEVPLSAERIFVGKARRMKVLDQRGIEAVIIARSRSGKRVVRLKGGDPFVFGRGGEEIQAFAAAGIPFEVVPGISSAISVPASAGIPVTHRELASSVTVVTGHEDPNKSNGSVDWDWVAGSLGTVVVLMGLERVEAICGRLIRGGRGSDTPAAAIAAGTWPQQRVVVGSLDSLPGLVKREQLQPPATIVIGDVVTFSELAGQAGRPALAEAV